MPTVREEAPGARYAPSESTQSFHEAAETPQPGTPSINIDDTSPAERVITGASTLQDAGNAARANRGLARFRTGGSAMPRNEVTAADEYNSDVVDLLDLVGMCCYFIHTVSRSPTTNALQTPKSVRLVL